MNKVLDWNGIGLWNWTLAMGYLDLFIFGPSKPLELDSRTNGGLSLASELLATAIGGRY